MSTTESTSTTYAVDAAHSNIEFVVRHLMISKVRGKFTGVTGTVVVGANPAVPESIEATIDATTISTSDAQRDGHLASADFFDVATYPKLTFASTGIVATSDGFDLSGHLTIRDQTHPVVLKATFEGQTKDPWGNQRLGYEAHGKISRKEFGLVWNQALEAGGVAVSDEVKIELTVEVVAQA
jgi:polyisoprenoid-binding protein YceI